MYFGACVLVINENSEILAVSRKDDKQDFGLPGGKVEPGEIPMEAAIRELIEETGYGIADARYVSMIYHAQTDGKLTVTYEVPFAALQRVGTPTESAAVAWVKPDVLAGGKTFGDYNRGLLSACGIRFNDQRGYALPTKKKP